MDFDPNADYGPPTAPVWATYVPDRSPRFKTYTNRGHALNAFQYVKSAVLYRREDDQWVEVERYDRRGEHPCASCGRDVDPHYGRQKQWKRKNNKIVDPPQLVFFCGYDCARKEEQR